MLTFAEPWHPCDDKGFEEELRREVCRQHVLFRVDARVIASRQDRDDFLFELPHGRFALVHLTWKPERDAAWPFTRIYESADEMQEAIRRDIEEWESSHGT